MFEDFKCKHKIIEATPCSIYKLNSHNQTKTREELSSGVNFIKNVDMKALSILIKLLEIKYYHIKELSELMKD